MLTPILSLCFVALLALLGPHIKRFIQRLKVPGPLLPKGVKGNMADFMSSPGLFGSSMVTQYGPLYRVYTNNFGTLIALADPVLAQQLFKSQANMGHPWDGGLGHFLHRFLANSMGLTNGRKWTNIRKAFRTSMSTIAADNSLANIEASLEQWERDTLEPLARSGEVVSLKQVVGVLPAMIMLKIFFGHQFVQKHSEVLLRLITDADLIMKTALCNKMACTTLYKHFDTHANRTLKRFQSDWTEILLAYETSQEREEGNGGALDAVLKAISSTKKEAITFNEVADTLNEIIFTNQDVLTPAISWLFADLVVYPHLVDGLQLAGVCEMIDKASLENDFEKLLCLIKESARVHPFFPLSTPEVLSEDIHLGGYALPKGTYISIDQYSMNHNPQYWSQPSEFQPDRFHEVDDFTAKWGLFRFGFGARRCPGQYYGNLVMANVTAHLFSRWRLEPVDLEGINCHQDVPLAPGQITMLPDCKVVLKALISHQNKVQRGHSEDIQRLGTISNNTENNDEMENESNSKIVGQQDFTGLNPVFLSGSCSTDLLGPGVAVGVSMLPNSPLLSESGSRQLVTFLASLPHSSLIFLVDGLNSHNIKAMWKNANKPPCDKKALAIALDLGDKYNYFIEDAISHMEADVPDKKNWIKLVRWEDVEGKEMKEQQQITHQHYQVNSHLRKRVDDIAKEFLTYRRPQSKNSEPRLAHMVSYILGELPGILTGLEHGGCKYTTLAYPTARDKVGFNSVWDLTRDIHTKAEYSEFLKEIVAAAKGRKAKSGLALLPIDEYSENEMKMKIGEKALIRQQSYGGA